MLDFMILHPWVLAVVWLAMYIFDYASTLWLAGAYQNTLKEHIVYEGGVELNPNFEKQIARRQLPGPKFIALVLLLLVIILLSGLLTVYFVEFLAGALLLTWMFVNSRHLRNYAYVWYLRSRPGSLKGRSEYSYWLMQKTISSEAYIWSLIYLFLAMLIWHIFFLAGALACLSFAMRHSRLANRKLPVAGPPDTGG